MESSWTNLLERRKLLRTAGVSAAVAAAFSMKVTGAKAAPATDIDVDIINFALNLEYLEAEFYSRAVFGDGLAPTAVTGSGTNSGTLGAVIGGSKVPFKSRTTYQLAHQVATDELNHVLLLRDVLSMAGATVVARPAIDLQNSFTAAAIAAGVISAGQTFNPFADENSFLLGAFIFEDVGVSAYAGAAASITNPTYLTYAAQILAVEAYHAGSLRTRLYLGGYATQTNQIAALRAKASGTGPGQPITTPDDIGVLTNGLATIADVDSSALAHTRTPGQVLNVVYLGQGTTGGGFLPMGTNGNIKTAT